MRKRHFLKAAFVGGQLITGRHKPAIQDSLVMIEEGGIVYAGERNYVILYGIFCPKFGPFRVLFL